MFESYIMADSDRECYLLMNNNFAFKIYTFKHFEEDERTQLEFVNEYLITKKSKETAT
jgi:hypothetical protein